MMMGTTLTITTAFRSEFIGRYEDRLEFTFEDVRLQKQFIISRALRSVVGSQADHDRLRPIAPFTPRKRTTRQVENEVIEGPVPPEMKIVPYVTRLPPAKIPSGLASVLSTGLVRDIVGRVRNVHLPGVFNTDTYARHFKTLLWIEECKAE